MQDDLARAPEGFLGHPLVARYRRLQKVRLARLVHATNRKHVLGEINANGQNRHGLPLPGELMRFRTSHRGTQLLVAAARPVRDGEVPFIRQASQLPEKVTMTAQVPIECPLCHSSASFNVVDMRRKHLRCQTCGEFVLWRAAERRLQSSAAQTLEMLSREARNTTDKNYLYVIRGPSSDSAPHVDLQGEALPREDALGPTQ